MVRHRGWKVTLNCWRLWLLLGCHGFFDGAVLYSLKSELEGVLDYVTLFSLSTSTWMLEWRLQLIIKLETHFLSFFLFFLFPYHHKIFTFKSCATFFQHASSIIYFFFLNYYILNSVLVFYQQNKVSIHPTEVLLMLLYINIMWFNK